MMCSVSVTWFELISVICLSIFEVWLWHASVATDAAFVALYYNSADVMYKMW